LQKFLIIRTRNSNNYWNGHLYYGPPRVPSEVQNLKVHFFRFSKMALRFDIVKNLAYS